MTKICDFQEANFHAPGTDSNNIPPPHPTAQSLKNDKQKPQKNKKSIKLSFNKGKHTTTARVRDRQLKNRASEKQGSRETKPVVYLPERCMTKIKTIEIQTPRNPKCEISSTLTSNSANRSASHSSGNISFTGSSSHNNNISVQSQPPRRNRDNSCSSQGSAEYIGGYCVRMSKNSSLDDPCTVQVPEEVYSRAEKTDHEIMAAKSEPHLIDIDKTRNRQMKMKKSGVVVHRSGSGLDDSKSVDFGRHHVCNDTVRSEILVRLQNLVIIEVFGVKFSAKKSKLIKISTFF